jgi:hypothetical protein
MTAIANTCGAIFNILNSPHEYGRKRFVSSHFRVPRSSLFRLCNKFNETFGKGPGRPPETDEQCQIKLLEKRINDLSDENGKLEEELASKKRFEKAIVDRLKFVLICLGMQSRDIVVVIYQVFEIKTSHTHILQQIRLYAQRASEVMKHWFWPAAKDVDIDEIFIENDPLYVAVDPKSMAICKTAKHSSPTADLWQHFLAGLENLRRTTSDRGTAIVGAIKQRENHIHQSDLFHCKRAIAGELRKIEDSAYKTITQEEEAQKAMQKRKIQGKDARAAAQKYRTSKRKVNKAVEFFDNLEEGVKMVYDVLKLTTRYGRLNSMANAHSNLEFAADWFQLIVPNSWKKVKNAVKDPYLLTYLGEFKETVSKVFVETPNPEDREYILATLTKLWEDQAKRRWRGKDVKIPDLTMEFLAAQCSNLPDVIDQLFTVLDDIHRASSAVESVNSRIGLYRYNKRRFSDEYADLIAVWHNLMPFKEGKRRGKCPAQILGIFLPTFDIYQLLATG